MSWTLILLITLTATVLAIAATALIVHRHLVNKVTYMMDSLEDGELNFRFVENSRFNRALNRIRYIYEHTSNSGSSTNRIRGRNSSACSLTRL